MHAYEPTLACQMSQAQEKQTLWDSPRWLRLSLWANSSCFQLTLVVAWSPKPLPGPDSILSALWLLHPPLSHVSLFLFCSLPHPILRTPLLAENGAHWAVFREKTSIFGNRWSCFPCKHLFMNHYLGKQCFVPISTLLMDKLQSMRPLM